MQVRGKSVRIAAIALGTALGSFAISPAQAFVVNIDATKPAGTNITIPKTRSYEIGWIGKAQGGAYDSENVDCADASCTGGWENGFGIAPADFATNPNYTIHIFLAFPRTGGLTYSSAAEALANYQTGPIYEFGESVVNGVSSGAALFEGANASPLTVRLTAGDYALGYIDLTPDYTNNFGGVSLSFASVPEPATWTMVICGVMTTGLTLRRRWRAASRTAS